MNSADRIKVIEAMHDREMEIIRTKGREYTIGAEEGNDLDTLANLKNVAARTGTTPFQVWATYFLKHADAITTYVMDPTRELSESIHGRIDDARTYLGMLECLVVEAECPEVEAAPEETVDCCGACRDEGVPEPPKLKVGSKVRVVDPSPVSGRLRAGSEHVVASVANFGSTVLVTLEGGGPRQWSADRFEVLS